MARRLGDGLLRNSPHRGRGRPVLPAEEPVQERASREGQAQRAVSSVPLGVTRISVTRLKILPRSALVRDRN